MFDRLDESHSLINPAKLLSFQKPLVLAPHPDDEVFGCGGLLACWSELGLRPKVIVLTDGSRQAGNRESESQQAAQILGYDIAFWQIPDRSLRCTDPLIGIIATAINTDQPDVILTPTLAEPHPDHQITTLALVCALARSAACPDVLLYESGGTLAHANALIDISQVRELKDRAMAAFKSQEAFQPYRSRITARDHFRALSLGSAVQSAEAYYHAPLSTDGWQALLPALEPLFLHRRNQAASPADVPLISVIVRTVGDPHLELTVSSILAQTYPRVEILIIDALGTTEIRSLHQGACVSMRWLRGDGHLSRPQAANLGLREAIGEYFIFLDDDDLWTPEHLQKLLAALNVEPRALAAHSDVSVVGIDGREIKRYDRPFRHEAIRFSNVLPIHSVLFRRIVVTKHRCSFDESLPVLEDWDFWLQIASHADFTHVPGVSAIYRFQDKSGLHSQDGPNYFLKWREQILSKWLKRWDAQSLVAAASWYAGELDATRDDLAVVKKRNLSLFQQNQVFSQHINDLKANFARVEAENLVQERTVAEVNAVIAELTQQKFDFSQQVSDLKAKLTLADSQHLEHIIKLTDITLDREKLYHRLEITESRLRTLEDFGRQARERPFRFTTKLLLRWVYERLPVNAQRTVLRARNGMRYLAKGEWGAFLDRLKQILSERVQGQTELSGLRFVVLSPPHTSFIADLIEGTLRGIDIACSRISFFDPSHDKDAGVLYFVISPQFFKALPPPEKRIIFQVEQAVSERWFDQNTVDILENSLAVIEFSRRNIPLLASKGIVYPHIFYVPFGGIVGRLRSHGLSNNNTVLFYGDASSPRRKRYLEAIAKKFSLRIVTNEFGSNMAKALSEAAVVINIHYYDGAMLETTRIFESLSSGARIVSESAPDLDDYPGLSDVVDFVPVDNIEAMVLAIQDVLRDEQTENDFDRSKALNDYLRQSQLRFNFMFLRALLGRGLIDYSTFERASGYQDHHFFALSLPETFQRRQQFEALKVPEAMVFDGLRAPKGWIGCALSYKYLCRSALRTGKTRLSILEDDVLLPIEHRQIRNAILAYLDRCDSTGKPWDIFVGMIAQLKEDTVVSSVEHFEGLTFITLNRMTSMVYNIYNKSALRLIANWDETNDDPIVNTIDRFLESQSELRVLTVLEPIFGHREDMHSTLWGFKNSQYDEMISTTRNKLQSLVHEFERSQAGRPSAVGKNTQ